MGGLISKGVWTQYPDPKRKVMLGTKRLYSRKIGERGEVVKHKCSGKSLCRNGSYTGVLILCWGLEQACRELMPQRDIEPAYLIPYYFVFRQ